MTVTRTDTANLIERLHKLWSTGDVAAIPTIYAPDFVAHMSATSGLGTLRGHTEVEEAIRRVRNAVSGFTETIEDMIIEGDRVVTRYIVTGTHTGPIFDAAPTGQPIRVHEISVFRIRDGLVAEQWCGRVVDQ
jgi:predicted ester cyclase